MNRHSILVGNTYRTAAGELRRVTARDGEKVTYASTPPASGASTPPASGAITGASPQALPVDQFAAEAQDDTTPEPGWRSRRPPERQGAEGGMW